VLPPRHSEHVSTTLARSGSARTRLGWVLLLAALVAGLSGCAAAGDRAASRQLDRLQQAIVNEAVVDFRRGFDPVVLARWATNEPSAYGSGDGQQFDQQVEALSWSSEDGMDAVVDLRLTVSTPGFQSSSFGSGSYGPGRAQRCVRIHVGAANNNTVVRIDCADRPAAMVPPAPPPPKPLNEAALRRAMQRSSLREAETAARTAFPGLSITAEVVDGSWVVVVIRERPAPACMGGTRSPRADVQVRTVSRIRPGEADCASARFVRGPT
jgi:hypothetical protein